MKVYIVLKDYSRSCCDNFFEDTEVHSVYANEEDAKKAVTELTAAHGTYSDYTYYVEEHDLIDKQPQQ